MTIDISNHTDYAADDAAFYVSSLRLNGHVVTGHITSVSPTFVGSKAGYRLSEYDTAGPSMEVSNITKK
ncbi:hypothetical protein J8I87_14905 [Paraburkholderia sp. LEh10]|uniref:hypothetical protein n=1 Tax=Paraburkholderia sp. LEh10 TaxID=2821353 RepID=UPI001AEBA089|nr:hypothetical protein [Paraburkholderia sp. LEh10]MBP0590977.1 hypothetical protein [Paraburkholderia sp. LEh10]